MEKKNLLLIVPKLDQGGLERVCVRTARILSDRFRVTIAAFDPSDPAYDLTGLDVRDLRAPALKNRAGKVFRVLQRALRLRRLKGQIRADICYSFGPTANRANLLAGGRGKIWCGLRSWADVSSSRQLAWTSGRADELYETMYAKLSKDERYKRTGDFMEDYRRQTEIQKLIEEEILAELVYVN